MFLLFKFKPRLIHPHIANIQLTFTTELKTLQKTKWKLKKNKRNVCCSTKSCGCVSTQVGKLVEVEVKLYRVNKGAS